MSRCDSLGRRIPKRRFSWPRAPREIGHTCWYYIEGCGLRVYIQEPGTKVQSSILPWRSLLSAMGWWRRWRGFKPGSPDE